MYIINLIFAYINLLIVIPDYIANIQTNEFGSSNEVDGLMWVDLDKTVTMVERENNYSGVHLDKCVEVVAEKQLICPFHEQ